MKFGVGDFVNDITLNAKIQKDHSSGDVPAYGWNITLVWFIDCY